jgi:sialidase-1
MRAIRTAATVCVVLSGCVAPRVMSPPTWHIDLERRGVGYPVYRIPALAVTNKGTLIASYDGRPTMADVPSNIALLVRRSVDGGKTWLPRHVVRADTAPLGFGDPSLLVDRTTGRIFLFHVASVRQGFAGSALGNNENNPDVLQADYSWSDDDGVTWTHRRITAAIKHPAWGGIFAASGEGIQLEYGAHAGRLVQQFVVRQGNANFAVSVYSDDHGATWRSGELVGPGADENKTVELSDGRVMLNSRAKPFRLVAYSTDGGRSYSALRPDSQLVDPANNGAIIRYDPKAPRGSARARRVVFSNTAHATERRNLTVRLSCDDGRSWPAALVIEAGPSAYSTITTLPGGDIGVLYERGPYEFITFTRFTPRWPRSCG